MKWTDYEREFVRLCYSHVRTDSMAKHLGRTESSVYQVAANMGLRKSREFIAMSCWAQGKVNGTRHGFQKGRETWNKGLCWYAGGRAKESWFKPGHMPHTWRPVGSERLGRDGYLYRKVADTRHKPTDWKLAHVVEWERHNGSVPEGCIVVFNNGNKEDKEVTREEAKEYVRNYGR